MTRFWMTIGRLARHEQIVLAVLAVIVGAGGAVAAIIFQEGISFVQQLVYGTGEERFSSYVAQMDRWQVVALPALGGLIVGLLIHFAMPHKRPEGVADVMEACAGYNGHISFRRGVVAALASMITIGTGGSSGREGPVVHMAATFSAQLSNLLHLNGALGRTLAACGVASGVAASFNAPFAGIFFALEIIKGEFALSRFAPIVISAVTGTIIHRNYYGNETIFQIPYHEITSYWEFPAFALLGVFSAVLAMTLVWSIGVVQSGFKRTPIPLWFRPALAGLWVGAIALYFPNVLGVGYEATDMALNEMLSFELLIALIVAKTMATALTLGSGAAGGIFSPSLFLGAMLGGAFGIVATEFLPHLSSGHGAYTIVGMGAVAGAALGAPISTILMVFELTGDYTLTIAVMVATIIASQIMSMGWGHSFFTWQLMRRNVDLKRVSEDQVARSSTLERVPKNYVAVVGSINEVIAFVKNKDYTAPDYFLLHGETTKDITAGLTKESVLEYLAGIKDFEGLKDSLEEPPIILSPHSTLREAVELLIREGKDCALLGEEGPDPQVRIMVRKDDLRNNWTLRLLAFDSLNRR